MADPISVAHLVITGIGMLGSGILGGWVAATKVARRQQKTDDDIAQLQSDVAKAARAAEVKQDIDQVKADLAKAARSTEVAQELAGEKAGRERIHREIETMIKRLDAGDGEFKANIREISGLTARVESAVSTLDRVRDGLGQMVPRAEFLLCQQAHQFQRKTE